MIPLHPYDPPRIGPYRLHARLGENTGARIYLATAGNRTPVGLWVTRPHLSSLPAFREAFARRAGLSRELNSPYVASVVDTSADEAVAWAAVSRPFGPTLAECVSTNGPLPAAALPPLALAMAQGLADLHAVGCVHGSLGPDGILLTEHGTVLADPGLQTASADAGVGAPRSSLAAPEGGGTPPDDIVSWATALCFAASGVEGPEGLEQVPLQLRGLIETCLGNHAELRPTSSDLVRILGGPTAPGAWPHDVAAVIRRHANAAEHAFAASDADTRPRRRRGRVAALTASGVALAVLAAGSVWAFSSAGPGDDGQAAEDGPIPDVGCLEVEDLPEPSEPIDDLDAFGVDFSADGEALLVSSAEHGSTVWDWAAGTEIARPSDDAHWFSAGEFAPVGCFVADLRAETFRDYSHDHSLLATHDLSTGETDEHLGPQTQRVLDGLDTPRDAESFAFSPSGGLLAVVLGYEYYASHDERSPNIGIIDLATGELEHEWGSQETIRDVAFVDEERLLADTSSSLQLHDAESGEQLSTIRDYTGGGFALVPGTEEVVYPSNDHLVRWDMTEQAELDRFEIQEFTEADQDLAYTTGIEVDPDLGLLQFSWSEPGPDDNFTGPDADVSGRSYDHHGHVWDLRTGQEIDPDDGVMARPIAFHPEGEAIASISPEGDVEILDPDSLSTVDVLP